MKLFNQFTITKLIIVFSCFVQSQTISNDSLEVSRLKNHVSTLDYISRQTSSNKFYIQLGQTYTDSILQIDPENKYALQFNKKFNLTLSTCDQNMNHVVELFPFFQGFPEYMGFADDPIEYAYDDALNKLFSLKHIKLSKSPIKDANITSIVIRNNCDDEMFEIVNQTVIENTNHYILPPHEIISIVGEKDYEMLINGNLSDDLIFPIMESLNLERLGVFIVNDIDVIDNKIWFVESKFTTFNKDTGLSEPIFAKGFCHDKRAIGILDILIMLIESILLLTFLSFLTTFTNRKKLNSTNILSSLSYGFIYKLEFVSKTFIIPLVFSFVMIYSLSYIMPTPEDHYMEFSAKIWVFLLTLGMRLVPTIINLYIINRMDLDGFHTINGYRTFANTSLYATYLPLEIFYLIQYDKMFTEAQFVSIFVTFCIGDLLARSYFQFTAISKNSSLKTQSFIGLILGIIGLLIFNLIILSKLSIKNLLITIVLIVPISILHRLIEVYLNKKYEQNIRSSSEIKFFSDIPFIKSLIDPQVKIFDQVKESMSNSELNIFTIIGPSGIGKTRSLFETKEAFENNDWEWYYGDCDEVQGETAISFEPFLEAFKNLLKIEEFTNRGEQLDSSLGSVVDVGSAIIDVDTSSFVKNYDRDGNQKMTEICVDIIEKLERRKKKTVFVMEDIHWIDPESYSFLKLFIQMINRNKFLRGNMCIIFSMRCEIDNKFRGPSSIEFNNDLKELQINSSFKFSIQELLNENDFDVTDFAKQLSVQNNNFKIQNNSLVQINNLFNNAISEFVVDYITPLYVTKVIEKWIDDGLLIYSPEGYRLKSAISSENLPNDTGVDSYYHTIIGNYDEKWQRLLESAAIIGNKFNAEILASVWRYELLDVLSFLEKAVQDKLLIDISEEDNIYMFGVKSKVGSGKRIISSIKSYFSSYDTDESEKQITLEYNKRYIDLQHDIIDNTHNYSIEKILKTLRRLCTLLINNSYKLKAEKLIFELIVRLVDKHEIEKLKSVQSFLEGYTVFNNSVQIINNIIYIIDSDGPKNQLQSIEKKLSSQNHEKGSLDYNLRLYTLLLHEGKVDNNVNRLSENELNYIENNLLSDFEGYVKVCLSLLYTDEKYILNDELVGKDQVYEYYSQKMDFLEDLISNITDIESYLDIEINLWKLNLQISQSHSNPSKVDKEALDKTSIEILKNIKNNKQSRHILPFAYTARFRVLSSVYCNDEKSIQEFRDNLILKDQFKDINWVKSVLSFLNTRSSKIYFKQYNYEGIDVLNQCEEVIYKYVDDAVWTSSIEYLLCAKSDYYLSSGDYKSALEVNFKNLDLIVSNIGDNNIHYANVSSIISNIYKSMGDMEKSKQWDLKSSKVLKK